MKVFLTGATGYVGTVVAEKLRAAGHRVVGLARNDAAEAVLRERNIEPYRGDLQEPEGLISAAKAADGVIHTAFIHDFNNFDSAVDIERKVIAAFVQALVNSDKPLIATSGTGLLGDTGSELVDETAAIDPTFVLAARAQAEQDILRAAEQGIRSLVIRLPLFVYGRGGSVFIPMQMQAGKQTGVVHYIETGTNQASAVHVDDAAQLYVLALEALALQKVAAGSIFHATTRSGITAKAMAEAISRAVGCRTESLALEDAQVTLGPVVTAFMSMNNQVSATKAMTELAWQPGGYPDLLDDIEHGSYRQMLNSTL
ncbi:SDR family oxidoreductase [Leptolyngbya sp. FACHB-261]|uniref:SDR family oxidoreductase n=1 Tax=Leptolyngbya sp. FACHB-261 TaxID=2692806 RepID=UPI001684B405|nr:SDR family oxidoreductase [Leptolyngbya sp. FACHB-261]MBD2099480.1 SDR family oxidoreductase [Leptolyngbya sp. FACHB-261]